MPQHAHDRALRALAGVVGARRRGARGQRRIRLLRIAAVRGHERWSTSRRPGTAGSSCSRKAACAAFWRRATPRRAGHGERPRAALRLGRGARARRASRPRSRSIDAALAHPCGRLSGVVSPMQIDNCTADLLRDSHEAARERGLPFTVHVAQSVIEVQRDDPAPRQDADPMGACASACSGPARSSATRCFSTRIPGSAGTPGATSR